MSYNRRPNDNPTSSTSAPPSRLPHSKRSTSNPDVKEDVNKATRRNSIFSRFTHVLSKSPIPDSNLSSLSRPPPVTPTKAHLSNEQGKNSLANAFFKCGESALFGRPVRHFTDPDLRRILPKDRYHPSGGFTRRGSSDSRDLEWASSMQPDSSSEIMFNTGNYKYEIEMPPEGEAVYYLRKAAEMGHVKAMGVLGFCYEFGLGFRHTQTIHHHQAQFQAHLLAISQNITELHDEPERADLEQRENESAPDSKMMEAEDGETVDDQRDTNAYQMEGHIESEGGKHSSIASGGSGEVDSEKSMLKLREERQRREQGRVMDHEAMKVAVNLVQQCLTVSIGHDKFLSERTRFDPSAFSPVVVPLIEAAEQRWIGLQRNQKKGHDPETTPSPFHSLKLAFGHVDRRHVERSSAPSNYVMAEKWYTKAAKEGTDVVGDGLSKARLAFLRKYGRPGIRIDRVEAENWAAQLKADKENSKTPQSYDPLAWLRKAADGEGLAAAEYCIGVCYHDGFGTARDERVALQYYLKSAAKGNARGMGILGYCFGEGVGGLLKNEREALRWYRMAAALSESVAIYNLGYCYEDGIGVGCETVLRCPVDESEPSLAVEEEREIEVDKETGKRVWLKRTGTRDEWLAFKWYELAARMDNAFAQNSLGYCYEDGIGLPPLSLSSQRRHKDPFTAVVWYRRSAEQGYPWAQCNLGYCYQNGIGIRTGKDEVESARWYAQAARQGHARAQHNLAYCYQNGIGVARDDVLALTYFQKSAEQGNVFAFHSLGYCYQNGVGVAANDEEAVKWFTLSAKAGHAPAQLALAFCYRNGTGVARDEATAFMWFTKAATQGNSLAQNSLGYCYEDGLGVEKDPTQAVYWYKQAAVQGNPWAQCNLGFCFASGIGMPEEQPQPTEALYWYRVAAGQGHARAQNKLGQAYANGSLGLVKNPVKAINWWRRAATQGYVSAQLSLAISLEEGTGTAVDYEEALIWYQKAATAGDRYAHARLRRLLTLLALESMPYKYGHSACAA